MKLNNKHSAIGILIILLVVVFVSSNASLLQIYPKNNSIITERQPAFKWAGEANKLLIDDNEEFISPIIEDIKGNSYQTKDKLNFTTYYWKLIGSTNSSVFRFGIDSVVALELENNANIYNITNIGNTELDVEVVEENNSIWKITGNFLLRLNKTQRFSLKNDILPK